MRNSALTVLFVVCVCHFTSCQPVVPIYDIQGTGKSSPYQGDVVTTHGVVTGDFQHDHELKGFFIQDTLGDGNPATSDGLFIYDNLVGMDVKEGDLLRVTGEIDEQFGLTLMTHVASIVILDSGYVISPIVVNLPVSHIDSLERYESMLVSFEQTLTVTENYTLGRFGELLLSSIGPLINPTNIVDPNDNPASGTNSQGMSNVAEIATLNKTYERSTILLDDGSLKLNPDPVPYIDPLTKTIRIGSTLSNLTGVLSFHFGSFKVHPTQPVIFDYQSRPAIPPVGEADVKIAGFNVLNYFNGDGLGGGFPTARGASTPAEFERQKAKIFEALKVIDADIIGLMEIENDGDDSTSAIFDLVEGLNNVMGLEGTYAIVPDPTGVNGNPGSDAIKVALIYKVDRVTLAGPSLADTQAVYSRNPVAQTFTINDTKDTFTVIANHFKSKNCSNAIGLDEDQNDGQSCYNHQRKLQSAALLAFVEKNQVVTKNSDILILGDLNAYEEEDPIDTMRAYGLIPLINNTYTYVFQGKKGTLDHAIATHSLATKISGTAVWHINVNEPRILDYNQEFNPPALYNADPYRSSDHDPIIIGITYSNTPDTTSTGIIEKQDDENVFSVYPNPGNTFKLVINDEGTYKIEVFDSMGNSIISGETVSDQTVLNLSNQPKGFYFLSAFSTISSQHYTRRLVVQ